MLPGDDSEQGETPSEGESANIASNESRMTYQLPPGRVIITPETPFGPIDRENDTAINLWKELGLPLLGSVKSHIRLTEKPPRTAAERRVDRGRRGVQKGNLLA